MPRCKMIKISTSVLEQVALISERCFKRNEVAKMLEVSTSYVSRLLNRDFEETNIYIYEKIEKFIADNKHLLVQKEPESIVVVEKTNTIPKYIAEKFNPNWKRRIPYEGDKNGYDPPQIWVRKHDDPNYYKNKPKKKDKPLRSQK